MKDSIFELERKVNQPDMYNRNVYINTIKAMQKIADIRKRREDRFWDNRMKLAKVQKIEDINQELEKHFGLISDPQVRQEVQEREMEKIKVKEENKGRGQITIEME